MEQLGQDYAATQEQLTQSQASLAQMSEQLMNKQNELDTVMRERDEKLMQVMDQIADKENELEDLRKNNETDDISAKPAGNDVSIYRTESEELAERLSGSQDRLLELQGAVESRDEKMRELMQKLAEGDNEQRSTKQEAELQTEELTEQIKMLQEQLLQSDSSLKTQQSEMDKASKQLLDTQSLIQDLQNEVSEKDNLIIELYGLKEKEEDNHRIGIDQLNEEFREKIRNT
ncbi:hypothetical protein OS493_002262 [Desmophyllum pertusum]|uniref:Uncharacterized protein n=1 Tax=Desmophyllum pertusum TaxID=174260 RepID=A0A9W9Z7S0_9CNID|nr:hypothetical protein OS493_002262 [Desmophyllum pertusum]